jgi:hypothetical protein
MKKQNGYTTIALVIIGLYVAAAVGWVWNIVKIIGADWSHIGGMLIARVIGAFLAPLGAILGFF